MLLRHFAHSSCAALAVAAAPVLANKADDAPPTIIVTSQQTSTIENPPGTTASIDVARIAETVNATNVEDALKYLPSLLVRKRHIGDTQAPLATRTSGVGASARSLIYADGVLLSALIGNNNSTASPRWGLVSPQEIARIDVIYGPFSAAYPGNAIGAVVNITTRLPDQLEATVEGGVNVQRFDQYATSGAYPAYRAGATIGDRIGPFAFFASANHVTSNSQPLAYATLARPATMSGTANTRGAFPDVNRLGAPIVVIGASGFERQAQDILKLKLALDIAPGVQLAYVGGAFLNATDATAETYLSNASGPVFAGAANMDGFAYTIPASAFSNNVYRFEERHFAHALSATGTSDRFDWQVVGTAYDYDKSVQRIPTTALPAATGGGAGTITRLDGTGWTTFDAKGLWRSGADAAHAVGFGVHYDRFVLNSDRFATADWIRGGEGALTLASRGRTRTVGLWAQDAWRLTPALTLTIGGRYEWWRAYDGFNFALAPALSVRQPELSAARFSPKAALAWTPGDGWKIAWSFGKAYRFPTVTELYQAVTTGPTITVPNPTLRPERALSQELAIERSDARGSMRLSLFNEVIADALLSQSAVLVPGSPTLFNFVQNIDRLRARGVELAIDQRDVLKGFDLSGSFTFVDARIRSNPVFPAAIGKQTPQVPRTRATLVATWRPDAQISLVGAVRYSARSFATIDNSDSVSNTFQGFDGYVVGDVRATFRAGPRWTLGLGIDNIGDARYFLFHPFPGRSFSVDVRWTL